ncbi:iron dicitrate transporter FecR [Tsuneonella deserti]|uniref:Iron dicitrate transporter FecR n=2 Tax=Tsuneonella deserti TaxID=2035528 RepID=A0ABQ1RYW6_9SPHN|nr:iron dicitrate transporter FecR [Tsuneonella deserti]
MLEPHAPELRAEFEAWLGADPAHAKAYDALERFATLSQRLPAPERRPRRQAVGPRRLAPAFGAIALVATAATGLLLLVTGREAATYAAVANPGPAIRLYRLSDGSTITLDADTNLDVAIKPASREVRIRSGRARFKVTDEPDRPFTVSSDGGRVTANGSEFDVALNGDRMTVVALQGDVHVSPDGSDRPAVPLANGAAVQVEGASVDMTSVSREDRLWPAGRLSFDNTPLEKIVATANRLGGPPIRLGSDGIGTLKVTAVLDLRDTRALARKLAAALELKVDDRGGEVVLTR